MRVGSNVYSKVYALFPYIGTLAAELIVGLTDKPLYDTDGYSDYTLCATVSVMEDVNEYLVSCQSSCVSGRYLFIRWNESSTKLSLAEVQVYAGITSSLLTLVRFSQIATHQYCR